MRITQSVEHFGMDHRQPAAFSTGLQTYVVSRAGRAHDGAPPHPSSPHSSTR